MYPLARMRQSKGFPAPTCWTWCRISVVQLCVSALYHLGARELVDLREIVEQQSAGNRGAAADPVEVNVFPTRARPDADDVALVRDDVVQLELAEEAEQRRILLALHLPRLDRDRQVLAVRELPARDRVGDAGRAPGGEKHVEAFDPIEIVGALLPALDDSGRRRIRKVPDVADRHEVAVDLGARQPRDVGLPIPRA